MTKYTQELLQEAVSNSESFSGVLRYLGLRQAGGTQTHIKSRVIHFGIDYSHFTGQGHMSGKTSKKRKRAEEILVLREEGSRRTKTHQLRRAMQEMGIPYVCCECLVQDQYNGKPIVLEVDHINGMSWDDRLENLRFLCPNCHSQQETNGPHKHTKL